MKKRIISLILTLAMLVSIVAVLPIASAAANTSLAGADVTLADGVFLNFYISADEAVSVTNAQYKDGYYVITKELAAKEMGDDVTVQLMNGTTAVGDEHTYSVKQYAESILAGNYDAPTKALVSAMLNYGAAAQTYFGYKTDALVGTPVTDTTALKAAEVSDVSVTDAADIYIGASLVLEGAMKLRFYFKGNVQITVDGADLTEVNEQDYCYAEISIAPDGMSHVYEVKSGETTVKYSVLNYLKNNADNPELSSIVASIYAYGVAAEKYVFAENCTHEGVELNEVQLPTILNNGIKSGVCPTCGKTVTEVSDKTLANEKKINSSSSSSAFYSDGVSIVNTVLDGGKHFYPAAENGYEGRDLYVEFSFLYNETLKNNTKGMIDFFRFEKNDGSGGNTVYFMQFKDQNTKDWYAPYAGSFETGDRIGDEASTSDKVANNYSHSIISGPTMPDHYQVSGETPDDYVFIGEYGWHRLGLRLHQEATIKNGAVAYTITAHFYIDGELVSEYVYAPSTNNLLFTAKVVNGEVVYSEDRKSVV